MASSNPRPWNPIRAYWECLAADAKPGKVTSFAHSMQAKDNETMGLSWIVYNSHEDRDRLNAKMMEDPRIKDMMDPETFPFDGMPMFRDGFQSFNVEI